MQNYSNNPAHVRVDFFKGGDDGPTKWGYTDMLDMTGFYDTISAPDAVVAAWELHHGSRYRGMWGVCLEPYHRHAHPVIFKVQ